jgi:hypothetical protein
VYVLFAAEHETVPVSVLLANLVQSFALSFCLPSSIFAVGDVPWKSAGSTGT